MTSLLRFKYLPLDVAIHLSATELRLTCLRIYNCNNGPVCDSSELKILMGSTESDSSQTLKTGEDNQGTILWVAVGEDAVTLLDLETMSPLIRHPYSEVVTFGGCQDDLMLVVNPHQKHLFSLSKPKILQLTLLIADYMNALGRLPGTPQMGSLTRKSFRRPGQQPDILKSTPDQHAPS